MLRLSPKHSLHRAQNAHLRRISQRIDIPADGGKAYSYLSPVVVPLLSCATICKKPWVHKWILPCPYLMELRCQIVLGNTYHLENRPGSDLLKELGGLSFFTNWRSGTLTDSGGFQMVSLLDLAEISVRQP